MYRNALLNAVAGSALALAVVGPASALDIDLGVASVSIGSNDSGGLEADIGVDVGGSSGVRAQSNNTIGGGGSLLGGSGSLLSTDTSASIGGAVTANTNTSVLGSDGLVDSDTTASVLGTPAEARVNVGGGTGLLGFFDPNVCVGDACTDPLGIFDPAPPPAPDRQPVVCGAGGCAIVDVVRNMSAAELARNKKLCREILIQQNAFDRDLVGVCRMIQTANR